MQSDWHIGVTTLLYADTGGGEAVGLHTEYEQDLKLECVPKMTHVPWTFHILIWLQLWRNKADVFGDQICQHVVSRGYRIPLFQLIVFNFFRVHTIHLFSTLNIQFIQWILIWRNSVSHRLRKILNAWFENLIWRFSLLSSAQWLVTHINTR